MADLAYTVYDLRLAYALSRGTKIALKVVRDVLIATKEVPTTLADVRDFVNTSMPGFTAEAADHWMDFERIYERHKRTNIYMLGIRDPRYPPTLRGIFDPPAVLYVRGDIGLFASLPGAAVVGTREASANGLRIAFRIGAYLSESNFTVVSGLALGIDAAAHEGALSVKKPNIAVLALGLDKISPPKNRPLAEQIVEAGGAVVSEHAMGTIPQKHFFVERNRIQIGLSAGSVIIEGKYKSGTMTQAAFCVREKRPLFAVVPSSEAKALGLVSEGPRSLVRQHRAYPVSSKNDYILMLDRLQESRRKLREQHGLPVLSSNDASRPPAFQEDMFP